MRAAVAVSFFALFNTIVSYAMLGSNETIDQPPPYNDTSWQGAFDKPLVEQTFNSLTVSNILVRHIFPTIMANNMERVITLQIENLGEQVHERRREQNLLSHFNTANRNIRLSDLAIAGFYYEKKKSYCYSNVLLILMAYHKDLLDRAKKKTFSGYFSNEIAKVKGEIEFILKALARVVEEDTLEKMKNYAREVSEKKWSEIKTSRELCSPNELNMLPILILGPANIKGNRSVYQHVLKYAYRDMQTLLFQESRQDVINFHKRLKLGFVSKGLMIGSDNFDYIDKLQRAVLEVIENRGFHFSNRNDASKTFTANVLSLGPIDTISFESMVSVIVNFCNTFGFFSQSNNFPGRAGRALLIESMVWLAEMYRTEKKETEANSILQVVHSLFDKLAKENYATCFSLTGVFPPHVVTTKQQPAKSASLLSSKPFLFL